MGTSKPRWKGTEMWTQRSIPKELLEKLIGKKGQNRAEGGRGGEGSH